MTAGAKAGAGDDRRGTEMRGPEGPSAPGLTRREVAGAGLAASAALVAPAAAHAARGRRQTRTADMVLLGGEVHTLDRRFTIAEAIAVRDGMVMATGTTREIRRLAGRRTTTIDLDGNSALPGINDSHVHGLAAGVSLPPLSLDVGFPTVRSIADIVDVVRDAAARTPPGTLIRGSGWNLALLDEVRADPTRLPTRQDLDAAAPDHPVVLRDFSFHTVWANSRALALAGITRDTPAPPGGVIDRDAAGEPIGLLRESAQAIVLEALPRLSTEQLRAGLRRAIGVLLSQGITSYTEPGLTADEIAVYRDALRNGALNNRVTMLLSSSGSLDAGGTAGGSVERLEQAMERYPRPRVFDPRLLQVRGVKIFADGIPPNETAWVYRPYLTGGGTGELVLSGERDADRARELGRIVQRAHAAGFQVGTHATGDRTIDVVAAAYAAAIRGTRRFRDPRHYVIHADLATDRAFRVLARYGLGANMNPAIKAAIADSMIAVMGAARARRQWPTRSALEAGVTLTSASDWPVTPPDWRAGVIAAVLRRDQVSGNVSGPEERLSVREALRTYTSAPAWQDGAAAWKGQLVPGKVADICVLDGRMPLTRAEVTDLAEIDVAMTILGGRVRYERTTTTRGARAALAAATSTGCAHGAQCCCQRAPELLAGRM
jgi:predicted amidohydrolase YtcJ